MEHIAIVTAFGAGLLSFLSPCILPLMPIYIAILIDSEILKTETLANDLMFFFIH